MISFIKISFKVLSRYRFSDYCTTLYSSKVLAWQLGTWLRTTLKAKFLRIDHFQTKWVFTMINFSTSAHTNATESNKALHLSENHLDDE